MTVGNTGRLHAWAHFDDLKMLIQKKYSDRIGHAKGMYRMTGREPKHLPRL